MKGAGGWALGFVALTAILAVGVVRITGSPADMARYRRDEERVEDLNRIADTIRQRLTGSKQDGRAPILPERFPPEQDPTADPEFRDPATGRRYRYERIDGRRYRLCATFEMSSAEFERRGRRLPGPGWRHAAGEACVEFDWTLPVAW